MSVSYVDVMTMHYMLEVIEGVCRSVGVDKLIEFVAMEILHKVSCRYDLTAHDLSSLALSALLLALKVCSEVHPMMKFKKLLEIFARLIAKKPHLMPKVGLSDLKEEVVRLEMVLVVNLGFEFDYLRIIGKDSILHNAILGLRLNSELITEAEGIIDTKEYKCSNICIRFPKSTIVCAVLKRVSEVKFFSFPLKRMHLVPKILSNKKELTDDMSLIPDLEVVSEESVNNALEVLDACKEMLSKSRSGTFDESQSSTDVTTPQAFTPLRNSPCIESEAQSAASASTGRVRSRSESEIDVLDDFVQQQEKFMSSVEDLVTDVTFLSEVSTHGEYVLVDIILSQEVFKRIANDVVEVIRSFQRPNQFEFDVKLQYTNDQSKLGVIGLDRSEVFLVIDLLISKFANEFGRYETTCRSRLQLTPDMRKFFFQEGRPWINYVREVANVSELKSLDDRFFEIYGPYNKVLLAMRRIMRLWPCCFVEINSVPTDSLHLIDCKLFSGRDVVLDYCSVQQGAIDVLVCGHNADEVDCCAQDMLHKLKFDDLRPTVLYGQTYEFPTVAKGIIIGKGHANLELFEKRYQCRIDFEDEINGVDFWLITLRAWGRRSTQECRSALTEKYEYCYEFNMGQKLLIIESSRYVKEIEKHFKVYIDKESLRANSEEIKICGLLANCSNASKELHNLVRIPHKMTVMEDHSSLRRAKERCDSLPVFRFCEKDERIRAIKKKSHYSAAIRFHPDLLNVFSEEVCYIFASDLRRDNAYYTVNLTTENANMNIYSCGSILSALRQIKSLEDMVYAAQRRTQSRSKVQRIYSFYAHFHISEDAHDFLRSSHVLAKASAQMHFSRRNGREYAFRIEGETCQCVLDFLRGALTLFRREPSRVRIFVEDLLLTSSRICLELIKETLRRRYVGISTTKELERIKYEAREKRFRGSMIYINNSPEFQAIIIDGDDDNVSCVTEFIRSVIGRYDGTNRDRSNSNETASNITRPLKNGWRAEDFSSYVTDNYRLFDNSLSNSGHKRQRVDEDPNRFIPKSACENAIILRPWSQEEEDGEVLNG